MKRIFVSLLFIVICLAIGYGVGMAIAHGLGGHKDVDSVKMMWAIALAFVSFLLALFVNTVLHEAGHMIGGLATGYRFMSFRIFTSSLVKTEKGYQWKKFNIPGTLGQCLMIPPTDTECEKIPYFWYNVSGVLANLVILVLTGLPLLLCDLPTVPFSICLMMTIVAAWMFVFNTIPMTPGGMPNDGKNILTLWQYPEQRTLFSNMLNAAAAQNDGMRLTEAPKEWFESSPLNDEWTVMELAARNLSMGQLIDQLDFGQAILVGEEIMAIGNNLPIIYRMETASDLIYLYLAQEGPCERVTELFDKRTRRYIEGSAKYSAMKRVTLFAIELIVKERRDEAMKHYDAVKDHIDSFAAPGEARTALAVMDNILVHTGSATKHEE